MNEDKLRFYNNQLNYYKNLADYYEQLSCMLRNVEPQENFYFPEGLNDVQESLTTLKNKMHEYNDILDFLYIIEPELRLRKYGNKTIKLFIKKLARQARLYEKSLRSDKLNKNTKKGE